MHLALALETDESTYQLSVCDPGVASAVGAGGVDISGRVLACPPAACMPVGCPGHELSVKGVAGCVDPTVGRCRSTLSNPR